ncbi:hypothetical protein EIP86_005240 [Pleurotus ostreatoroseus]|nr:hypothetical protein EIP86_005240 [Pleurotus ostreatoroseus]
MDEFVELCLQSCTNPNAREPAEDTHALYIALLRSPLLTREFLDELSRCIRFLTPGQIPQIVRDVVRVVSETLEAFSSSAASELANSGMGSRKKRRSDAEPLDKTKSLHAEHHALNLTLAAGLMATVLSSVPLQSLQHDVCNEVKQTVHEFCDTLKRSAKEGLKQVKHEQRRDIWGWEITLAALLRLQYLLGAAPQLEAPPSHGDKAVSRMITLLNSEFVLPELRAEVVSFLFVAAERNMTDRLQCRSLLHAISEGLMDHTDVFDTILTLLDRSKPDAMSTWDGRLHGLEEHQLPVVVFYLLLERWLPLFE